MEITADINWNLNPPYSSWLADYSCVFARNTTLHRTTCLSIRVLPNLNVHKCFNSLQMLWTFVALLWLDNVFLNSSVGWYVWRDWVQPCPFLPLWCPVSKVWYGQMGPIFSFIDHRAIWTDCRGWRTGGPLNKKDGLTRYGNSHVKDKTS